MTVCLMAEEILKETWKENIEMAHVWRNKWENDGEPY